MVVISDWITARGELDAQLYIGPDFKVPPTKDNLSNELQNAARRALGGTEYAKLVRRNTDGRFRHFDRRGAKLCLAVDGTTDSPVDTLKKYPEIPDGVTPTTVIVRSLMIKLADQYYKELSDAPDSPDQPA